MPGTGMMRTAADDQHRGRSSAGGSHAGGRIEKAGARHHDHCRDLAAGTGIAISHIAGGLLMAGSYIANRRLAIKPIDRFVLAGTGYTKNDFDALAAEGLSQRLTAGDFFHASKFQG